MLYKYPQAAYPYQLLIDENRRRGLADPEFELIDTGVFTEDRYFDVFIEYAKAEVEDVLMRITVYNRGPEAAALSLLPQVWFRNNWSWGRSRQSLLCRRSGPGVCSRSIRRLGTYRIDFETPKEFLFCDNETNFQKVFGMAGVKGYFKDGFNEYLIHGARDAVNPEKRGTKAAALYRLDIPPHGSATMRLRLRAGRGIKDAFGDFEQVFTDRIREADEFYAELHNGVEEEDARRVQRQALAGMLWNKQSYHYNVSQWLDGDPGQPRRLHNANLAVTRSGRTSTSATCFRCRTSGSTHGSPRGIWGFIVSRSSLIDPEFAKRQLILLAREWYMHPNGQLPAYEWAFGDVNPPVHAFAAWRIYRLEQMRTGKGDLDFLERIFHKLMLNFTWWVNRRDAKGRNIFQGGFLGLDNIGVFDRSAAAARPAA